ncbi:hypothetical protein GCM10023084_06500 [Streptomyces lacrimifluminis]
MCGRLSLSQLPSEEVNPESRDSEEQDAVAESRPPSVRDGPVEGEATEEEADGDDRGFADPPGEDVEYQVDQHPGSGPGANRSHRDGSHDSGGEV